MQRYTSKTIVEDEVIQHVVPVNEEVSLTFEINRGTETVNVDDKLLTNFEVAEARATSMFLDSSYIKKRVEMETYHLDNLHLGDIIEVDSVLYKVVSIEDNISGAKASMTIVADRWD
jgi:uncharacterized Zn finger protein